MRTLHGHKATRRIKWYNPKEIWKRNGEKHVNVFVVVVIEEKGYELLSVTSQIGIDRRGRHVLPHSVVAPKGRFAYGGNSEGTTIIYSIGAPVGRLEEAANKLVAALNTKPSEVADNRNQWFAPTGMNRGVLQVPKPQDIRTSI